MKEHISATIDRQLLGRARKHAREQRRSLSNVIEVALGNLFEQKPDSQTIVTTPARFRGAFDRRDCYGER